MKKFIDWIKEHEVGKNINWKQSVSDGVREIDKEDLSKDYPDHMKNMGAVWPFKLLGRKRKGKR